MFGECQQLQKKGERGGGKNQKGGGDLKKIGIISLSLYHGFKNVGGERMK